MRHLPTFPDRPQTGRARASRGALPGIAVALAALGLVTACVHGQNEPANLDFSSARWSEHGTYRVSYTSEVDPIPVDRLHRWTLHVESRSGEPVTDAAVQVDGDMPEHGHGLPTRPRVTRNLGNGDYLVEGVKFQMGGWWLVEFAVAGANGSDVARFNLKLAK